MSLAAFALRLCAVRAITGRTLAEGRVTDSQIVPDDASLKGAAPFVIVSTDDARTIAEEAGARDFNAPRTVDLAIDLVLASFVRVAVPVDDPEAPVEVVLEPTDENHELALDLIERQVWRALSDGATVWSRLFMKFSPKVGIITAKRGGGAENGTRFAARLLNIPIDTLVDPPFGRPPAGAWSELVAAMQTDDDLAPIAALLAAEIEGAALPVWRSDLVSRGFAADEIAGIGLEPDETDVGEDDVTVTVE